MNILSVILGDAVEGVGDPTVSGVVVDAGEIGRRNVDVVAVERRRLRRAKGWWSSVRLA